MAGALRYQGIEKLLVESCGVINGRQRLLRLRLQPRQALC